MLAEHVMDQISHIHAGPIRCQAFSQCSEDFHKMPFRDRGKICIGLHDGDDLSVGEQIDSAGEFTFAALGSLGHAAQHPVGSPKQAHCLRRLRVIPSADANCIVCDGRHWKVGPGVALG